MRTVGSLDDLEIAFAQSVEQHGFGVTLRAVVKFYYDHISSKIGAERALAQLHKHIENLALPDDAPEIRSSMN